MSNTPHSVLETLFYPFESERLGFEPARVLFVNAQNHHYLSRCSDLCLQQNFKPYADDLKAAGHICVPDLPDDEPCDLAMLLAPKNQSETLYLMARVLEQLKTDGVLVVAADNKAGGGRLVKNFASFGLEGVHSESRNKARVVWAQNTQIDHNAVQDALKKGSMQSVCDGAFYSQPGIYGWNKIDRGSALLMEHVSGDFSGCGADFGCGYGYLSHQLLQSHTPQFLTCIDADFRAVQACEVNLSKRDSSTQLHYKWMDLTRDQGSVRDLDFVIMNPPFHEGKTTDISIGERFIATAAKALKTDGKLWMVANKHLPYEAVLQSYFTAIEKVFEGDGFKVFYAVK